MSETANTQAHSGTRERLIEVAGHMFAERGFEGVTAKEICARAGANPAAVNYHFGGLDGLYEAVLVEAEARARAADQFHQLMAAPMPVEDKLRVIIGLVVRVIVSPGPSAWIVRLFSRELTQPSAIGRRTIGEATVPRLQGVRAMIGEYLGLPEDHPTVALASIIQSAPLMMLLIADRELLHTIHPALDLSPANEAALVEHFHSFTVAGLRSLRHEANGNGKPLNRR